MECQGRVKGVELYEPLSELVVYYHLYEVFLVLVLFGIQHGGCRGGIIEEGFDVCSKVRNVGIISS